MYEESEEMTIRRRPVYTLIDQDDYMILQLAGWVFAKQLRGFCHASANIYRRVMGTPSLRNLLAKYELE